METKPTEDLIRDAWESLGIAFAANASGVRHADPERALLDTLKEFHQDRKMLKLVLAWLNSYGSLVHVERVKALSSKLSMIELAWLGGLAEKQIAQGDLRWRSISQMVKQRIGKPSPHFQIEALDEYLLQRFGVDAQFKEFGLHISNVDPADSKKIRPFEFGVKMNLWLRMRALFGTSWRADMATVLVLNLAENPYQAEKLLGCAKETAYRNWKSLKDAEAEKLLKAAAA